MSSARTGRESLIGAPSAARTSLGYVTMVAVTAALFFCVQRYGERLVAHQAMTPTLTPPGAASHETTLAHVLLAIAVVVSVARAVGIAFEKFLEQPPVMGEIVAGILLGPSLLGWIWPSAYTFLLPQSAAPHLGLIAKVGVVLFMFLVGLELDARQLRQSPHATLGISHASILTPFILGATLALALYPIYGQSGTSFTVFSLFIGVSMSVTAFPVLARILTDRGLQSTPLGVTAIACAAVDDVTAWCLLAVVSGVASAQMGHAAWTIGLVFAYVTFMYVAARPLMRWIVAREDGASQHGSITTLASVLALLFLSAATTEAIGIHALFGAFLFGAVIPHDSRLAAQIRARMHDMVVVLLLPVFFAFTGMRTRLGLISGSTDWLLCLAIIGVATLGKFGGSVVASRFVGLSWRDSSAIGILMNTRGLMELIVLNVGLDMGVLSPTLFAMLVIMALATTFATTPVLNVLMRSRSVATA